ncbi:MAG: hypothetical protein ACR2P2_02700 [Nakamurella sp.]
MHDTWPDGAGLRIWPGETLVVEDPLDPATWWVVNLLLDTRDIWSEPRR